MILKTKFDYCGDNLEDSLKKLDRTLIDTEPFIKYAFYKAKKLINNNNSVTIIDNKELDMQQAHTSLILLSTIVKNDIYGSEDNPENGLNNQIFGEIGKMYQKNSEDKQFETYQKGAVPEIDNFKVLTERVRKKKNLYNCVNDISKQIFQRKEMIRPEAAREIKYLAKNMVMNYLKVNQDLRDPDSYKSPLKEIDFSDITIN